MQPLLIHCEDVSELEPRLDEAITAQYKPGLAVVFASDSLVDKSIIEPFASRGINVFGAGSFEEIADGKLSRRSISIMLLDLDPTWYDLRVFNQRDAHEMGENIARWAGESFSNPAVLLFVGGGGVLLNADAVLRGIFAVRPELPVYGGLTSSLVNNSRPPFFTHEGVYTRGGVALVLDNDQVELAGVAISGWKELGTPKRITRSEGNIVHEIEGEPAADFYERYFNVRADMSNVIASVGEYPLSFQRDDGTRVIRTAVRLDGESRAVYFGGEIPPNSWARFCSPNIVETIQHTVEEIQTFRDTGRGAQADAVLLFDCAIRSGAFGSYMRKEIQVIKELWGVPMAGFSSWGEIGNGVGEACALHNTVISLVMLRSKDGATAAGPRAEYSRRDVEEFVETFPPGADMESLKREVIQLRKQKSVLSHFVHLTSNDLEKERAKSEELLLNILPGAIAARLKNGETTIADSIPHATIVFADLAGFTAMSDKMNANDLVRLLNRLFSSFDELAHGYGVEKIKTIGDAYMAAAGLPEPRPDHARIALKLARGLLRITDKFNEKYKSDLRVRIGLNSGPVVAGVIGRRKFTYDLWGDAVNVASRMESNGVTGRIHVSSSTHDLLRDAYEFESRGEIEIKGKGKMRTYLFRENLD